MKKSLRQQVFEKFGGKCAYCGCELNKGWHVDEVLPVIRRKEYLRDKNHMIIWDDKKRHYKFKMVLTHPERMNIDNQMPSCASCNINKRDQSIEQFRSFIKGFIDSLNDYSVPYKIAKRYGLLTETGRDVRFYFENFNSLNQK